MNVLQGDGALLDRGLERLEQTFGQPDLARCVAQALDDFRIGLDGLAEALGLRRQQLLESRRFALDPRVDRDHLLEAAPAGAEVLRLAEKVGKGWFALLLSEHLEVDTVIPEYLLRAVAFAASSNSTDSVLRKMALHRMAQELFDNEIRDAVNGAGDMNAMSASDFIDAFKKHAPEDPLTALAEYVDECLQE